MALDMDDWREWCDYVEWSQLRELMGQPASYEWFVAERSKKKIEPLPLPG
jgi:hypothetical protein